MKQTIPFREAQPGEEVRGSTPAMIFAALKLGVDAIGPNGENASIVSAHPNLGIRTIRVDDGANVEVERR